MKMTSFIFLQNSRDASTKESESLQAARFLEEDEQQLPKVANGSFKNPIVRKNLKLKIEKKSKNRRIEENLSQNSLQETCLSNCDETIALNSNCV